MTCNVDICYTNELLWENVSCDISGKMILQKNCGSVRSGEMVAILGGSGAGKTSLLNALSGRMESTLSGKILYNNSTRTEKEWLITCSFVEQEDLFIKTLTVYETIEFAAKLKLPKLSNIERQNRINTVIAQLGLDKCKNTRVGDSCDKGISGGEKKRLSIAIELIKMPDILFLDEPTSGLDAFNAMNIVDCLNQISKNNNMIILMTIHQPRVDIVNMFDRIMLLSMGRTIWDGTLQDAIRHFETLGYKVPEMTNPVDFLLDISTVDFRTQIKRKNSESRIDLFFDKWKEVKLTKSSVCTNSTLKTSIASIGFKYWFQEFIVLLHRNLKELFYDKDVIVGYILVNTVIMLIMGILFRPLSTDPSGIQNRFGLLFFVCVHLSYGIVIPNVVLFTQKRSMIIRERTSGWYRSSTSYCAKIVSFFPIVVFISCIIALPLYWIVGLQANITKYLTFFAIVLVHAHTSSSLGILVSTFSKNVTMGQVIAPMFLLTMMLFGGQLVNLNNITIVLRWMKYLSIIAYANSAFVQNEFNGLQFDCPSCDGVTIVANQSLDFLSIGDCVLINFMMGIAYLIIGYIAYHFYCIKRLNLI